MAGAEVERIFEAVPPELRPAAARMLDAAMKIFKNDGMSERDVASFIADTSFLPILEQAALLDALPSFEDVCDDVFG